jgi:glucan phosphoethanolaminetransferase (alkaline phosphatase superfamily)
MKKTRKHSLKSTLRKVRILFFTLSAILFVTLPSYAGKGFMGNSMKNLKGVAGLTTDLKNSASLIENFVYWLPVIWLVLTAGGIFLAQHNQSEQGMKIVVGIALASFLLMGVAWGYDSYMVPS